jgi:hypothetical protein
MDQETMTQHFGIGFARNYPKKEYTMSLLLKNSFMALSVISPNL